MSEETKGVEVSVEIAPTQPEVDLAAELESTRQQLQKKTEIAENYRRGMLKAKGKLPAEESISEDESGETMDDKIRRIAREEQAQSEIVQLQAKEKATMDAILKRNKELETALKNRGQITSGTGQGSNQDRPGVTTDSYLSNEQIAYFKKQGKSDEWIETAKKNMIKASQVPK